ncbi:MAG: class I SAM-dependent RNA methyltransferase [Pedosphaera sp.]|nr:class I SAM-dependent RNA methyltransferase [Pedosphaera sp.]
MTWIFALASEQNTRKEGAIVGKILDLRQEGRSVVSLLEVQLALGSSFSVDSPVKNLELDRSQSTSASLNRGDRVELLITDLAFGGEGVGRVGDLVVFVPEVIPGERVEVKITDRKKTFARGILAGVLERSPHRTTPQCRYFGECGGCQYQHLEYGQQVLWKRKQVADLFQRVGGFDPGLIEPVIPCPQPYHYRNRILVRSQWNKPGQTLDLGFVRADSRLVADIEECAIAEPPLNDAIREWRAHPPPKGGLKTLLRIPPENWDVPEHSFFQNNFFLLPELVRVVRNRLQDSGVKSLIDAYCGVGFFGIETADLMESFVGVELDAPAIQAARRNAARRGILNGTFFAGDADQVLPRLLDAQAANQTAVLIDPPRAGCRPPTLAVLRTVQPRQILYVSCHPATLARDLKILCEGGRYELRSVTPFDMFPQTQHVECVADVRRPE